MALPKSQRRSGDGDLRERSPRDGDPLDPSEGPIRGRGANPPRDGDHRPARHNRSAVRDDLTLQVRGIGEVGVH